MEKKLLHFQRQNSHLSKQNRETLITASNFLKREECIQVHVKVYIGAVACCQKIMYLYNMYVLGNNSEVFDRT